MKKTSVKSLVKSIPGEIIEIFGDVPIISTEDQTRYNAMIAAFAQHIDPNDFIAWCYIKDLTDYQWEIWRYRRMKTEAVDYAHRALLKKRVDSLRAALANTRTEITTRATAKTAAVIKERGLQGDEHKKCVAEMERQIEADVKARTDHLQASIDHWNDYEPDENDLAGELPGWIGAHRSLDEQISLAEQKRTTALKDLERHLFGFGRALRDKLHQIIEGEVVEPGVGEISAESAPPKAGTPSWSTLGRDRFAVRRLPVRR
jgi:hypothetical protein